MIATRCPKATARPRSVADLRRDLGNIPLNRIRLEPPPGTATVADLDTPLGRGCELVDGTLVENTVGLEESYFAGWLLHKLWEYTEKRNLGAVTGEQGLYVILPKLARGPDVAFISWSRFPGGAMPKQGYPSVAPDFVVEVLSLGNTRAEMTRKRKEYFQAGVTRVWEVEPRDRVVTVYTSPTDGREFGEKDTLKPGPFLPGFAVRLKDWFAVLDRHG
jgi:Uma2 family endonuclease